VISTKFNVPIIRKIDLRGTNEDVVEIKKQYNIHIESEVCE
jgi:protein involved in ribonucleotide reduction